MTTTLLFSLILVQIGFTETPAVSLQTEPFAFDRVFPTPDGLLVCRQEQGLVLVFNTDGTVEATLGAGGGDEAMTLPTTASWIPQLKQYYVYDAAGRTFTVWDEDYTFVKAVTTDFPSFFEAGPLLYLDNGFAAAVSLQKGRYLVGRFNEDFGNADFDYSLQYRDLEDLSPVLHRTWVVRADMYGGPRLIMVQTFSREATLTDMQLKKKGTVSLAVPGWKEPDLKRLKKISKNPKELKSYRNAYSELVALQSIQGSLFMVGFRNILNGDGYYFQCYDASTGNALGQTYNAMHPPVGSGYGRLYLRSEGEGMTLHPVLVR